MYTLMTTGAVPEDMASRFLVHPSCQGSTLAEAPTSVSALAPTATTTATPTATPAPLPFDDVAHGPPTADWKPPADLATLIHDLQKGWPGPDGASAAGLALDAHPAQSAYGRYTDLDVRHRGHPLWSSEPWCTHYVLHYNGTLDYIYLHDGTGPHRPELVQVLEVPTPAELQTQIALPSDDWASDHIALGADVRLPPSS